MNLRRKVIMTSVVIGFLSLVEHILYQGSNIYGYVVKKNVCGKDTEDDSITDFLKQHFPSAYLIPINSFLWISQVWIRNSMVVRC